MMRLDRTTRASSLNKPRGAFLRVQVCVVPCSLLTIERG